VLLGTAVFALLVGGAALGLAASNSGSTSSQARAVTCAGSPKLTVQGVGLATAAPDVLTAVVQVQATAGSATAALAQDNAKVAAVVLSLAQAGLAKSDVQTTGLTLQQQYAFPGGVPRIIGYQVDNTVTATLRNVDTAGTAIDNIVGAGGNAVQIQSLSFSFKDPALVEDQARAHAVRQAVGHAHTMATAAGRRLGPVCSLTDQTQSQTVPVPFGDQVVAGRSAAAPPVPLEAGTQSESDQVTLVYAVR